MKKFLCLFLTAMLLVGAMIVPISAADLNDPELNIPENSPVGDYVAPQFIGIQTRVEGEGNTATQDIRFVATVASTKGKLLGFDIYANGKTYELTGANVYKTINAGNKTFSAEEGEYLFVVVIEDVPTNLTAVQFDVRTYVQYGEENTEVRSYNSTFEMNNTAFQENLTAPSPAWATQGGKGTEANPYVLNQNNFVNFYTYYQATAFSTTATEYFSLESNVKINDGDAAAWASNLPNVYFNKSMQAFTGYFNGNGNTLSGVCVSMSCVGNETNNLRRAALFEQVKGGTVENLRVTNSYFANHVTGTSNSNTGDVGTIAGRVNKGTIRNCYSEAIVSISTVSGSTAQQLIGGIASMMEGSSNPSTISNCVFAGTVNATGAVKAAAGGILGRVNSSTNLTATITNCLNLGTVNVSNSGVAGAILGANIGGNGTTVTFNNCFNLKNNYNLCGQPKANQTTYNTKVIEGYSADDGVTSITLAEFLALTSTDLPGWTFKDGYYPSPIAGLEIVCSSL